MALVGEALTTSLVSPVAEQQPPTVPAACVHATASVPSASSAANADVRATEAEERRRHPRAPVDLLVGLKFDSVQQFLAAYAEDISESGMFLRGDHAGAVREVGQQLELRFDAGNRRIVQGRARVVRVIDSGDQASGPGIGIEFVELDETSRKLLEAIVRIKLASVRTG
jgi:uncharacterized protein (TIGR02266 family)